MFTFPLYYSELVATKVTRVTSSSFAHMLITKGCQEQISGLQRSRAPFPGDEFFFQNFDVWKHACSLVLVLEDFDAEQLNQAESLVGLACVYWLLLLTRLPRWLGMPGTLKEHLLGTHLFGCTREIQTVRKV